MVELNPLVRGLDRQKRLGVLDQSALKVWADATPAPLTFGETFVFHAHVKLVETEQKRRTIQKLLRYAPPADGRDVTIVRRSLEALPCQLLEQLENHNYTIEITRHLISGIDPYLSARKGEDGTLLDMLDSAHLTESGKNPCIVVRTHWNNGQLQLDADTLLRAIGLALNSVLLGKPDSWYLAEPSKQGTPQRLQGRARSFV